MLKYCIGFSIDNSVLVLIISCVIVLLAQHSLEQVPVDIFPELNAPTITIMTEAPGFPADQVEQFITFPIESAVNGVPGVKRLRSSSTMNLSIVWIEFNWGEDLFRVRQMVSERLAEAKESLPEDIHCEISPTTSLTGEIMLLSLSSPDRTIDDLKLRAYAEYELRNRLLSISGIAQVVVIGGELPEYQILVNQDRLRLYNLTLQDIVDAAKKANNIAAGGYLLNIEGLELPLRQNAQIASEKDIASTMVAYFQGRPITIGDIAEVKMGGAPKRGTASELGKSCVVISIQKTPDANTLKLTKSIDLALDEMEKALPLGMKLNRHIVRQSDFIYLGIKNIISVLRDAAIFVAALLMLFLMNIRATMITLAALPMSLAISLIFLWLCNLSINVMTLGGMAVAIGSLVDDAIIDVENVYQRLLENKLKPLSQRVSVSEVVFAASNEIRTPMVFATVIIVIVFIPLLFLEGLEGRFFRPLGIAYIVAILASLLVSLTLIPAMCKHLLKNFQSNVEKESSLSLWLKKKYASALSFILNHRKEVMSGAILLTFLSILLASSFGSTFLPEFNEGTLTVFLMTPPGTSLEESDRLAKSVEIQMGQIQGIRSVIRRTGRAEKDMHAEPVSTSEIDIALKEGYKKNEMVRKIDEALKRIPGISIMIGQPIEHRLSHILSGTPASIAINVYGDDMEKLREIAKKIESELRSTDGLRDITANREIMILSLAINYKREEMARWGLTPSDVAEQIKIAFHGSVVAEVNQGLQRYQVCVRLEPEERSQIDHVRKLVLKGAKGAMVRLEEIASIGREQTSNLIARENGRRKAVVSCNVAENYNLGDMVKEIRKKIDPIVHRYGYTVSYGGQFEAQQSASRTIYFMGWIVVAIIFFLMYMALESWKCALLVMLNLPLSLIGGIVAIYVSESHSLWENTLALLGLGYRYYPPVISIASMVGFITLFGIAVRNGVLLVNHYIALEKQGKPLRDAIVQGSIERLSPILLTAFTSILGFIPIIVAAGEPGSELLAPLAIVTSGGLLSSTLLNLIVIPAGYSLFFEKKSI
ncbi:MAG: efflux RND transporter permease subunit [Candidatus Brocadiae bacterium]|nr:efflux RND transporter permease subunit [Candidatus Brocadiia bacterium]